MCVDYSVNYHLFNDYKNVTGKEISLGFVFCASDNLVNKDNKPINGDGTKADVTIGRIVNGIIETERTNVSVIMRTNDWTKYANQNVIMCMYILENDTVSYVCNSQVASGVASTVTYNQIFEGGNG